jgi:hypothetical protein
VVAAKPTEDTARRATTEAITKIISIFLVWSPPLLFSALKFLTYSI